ncbi:hypothetical protein GOP47_0008717 [Adiantum capillus-veneris]|uniref:Uncharacterized protein n=1 Tax=Adiantum capillus-veneris TaxID=13818 RepID=A0A9D4UZN3_ADICA|nr:hypothetical protein GOP47_0008717 [Adiantum capillus-veneris]
MWYLLVAAGAGYLAKKWQNGQKPRPLCGPNGRTSPPSSPRAAPARELNSSLSNSMPTTPPNGVHDPRPSFNSTRRELSTNGFHTLLENDVSSSPQEIKSNKRSTSREAYFVTSVHVKREEDPLVFTSKCSLTEVDNTDNNEEQQLNEELSPSPSSCCSSSSTVINSPIDSLPILQRSDSSVNFQGKAFDSQPARQNGVFHFQGNVQMKQFHELPNQTFSNSNLEGESPRDVSIMRENQQGTGNRRMLDAGIHTPLSCTGKRQRDETRADILLDDFVCTQFSKFDTKQDTSQMIARKNGSLSSPSHSIASRKASDGMGDVDSDAFVSLGLAMALCFMVSSGQKEMAKIGKVLRETEDLVSDMRKELEERKLRSCMDEEDNDEFFTIEPQEAVQECNTGVVFNSSDTCCKKDHCFRDDESLWSDVTEAAVQNRLHVYNFEENCGASSNHAEGSQDSEEEGENGGTMSMLELERKLWQVFQERQEERISELEGALELALSKLHAKEEELRWWKSRASWLMEQSFGSASVDLNTNRVERFEHANEEGVGHRPQFLYRENSLSAAEGCIESVGIKDSYLNLTGHAKGLLRTSSTCSVSSGESVMSMDVRAFMNAVNE